MSKKYPHICQDGHVEIGHSDNSSELCPLCRAADEIDRLNAEVKNWQGKCKDAVWADSAELKFTKAALAAANERAERLENSVLVLLVKGLGFYEPPSHGHAPIYAQIAWSNLENGGRDYTAEVLETLIESRRYEAYIVVRNVNDIRDRIEWYMKHDPTLAYKRSTPEPPATGATA